MSYKAQISRKRKQEMLLRSAEQKSTKAQEIISGKNNMNQNRQ